MDEDGLRQRLRLQDGVVARRQLLALGAAPHDVARMLRRRDLVVAVPGVYVDHTGPPTPRQREWIAVLACWPAALAAESALPDPPRDVVHVAVDRDRTSLRPIDGVRVHRTSDLDARVVWPRHPPRVRVEHALIDVASALVLAGRVAAAFDVLARVCHRRVTTPDRVVATLAVRPRVRGRRLLLGLLADLAAGACSELERGYLHRVERAHGLPRGERQVRRRADGRTTYVDVEYRPYRRIVELDGRAFHDGPAARDADARRDLVNLGRSDELTARITWGLVFETPCETAALVDQLLREGGWDGRMRACSACRVAA